MTPAELDAIIARAASVYPEDAGWDGDEAERALTTVTKHVPALAAALRGAWAERDAALAAVDAVRADYAPRREPPTYAELDAVESDDGGWLAMPDDTWNLYYTDMARKLAAWHRAHPEVDCAWRCVDADNIPRPWSELAALVARGGDRG